MSRRHVYFYTLVPVNFGVALEVLSGSPASWLPAPATWEGAGWQVELRADGAVPAPLASRMAVVELAGAAPGDPAVSGAALQPITWRAASGEGFFPVLEADLELARLNGDHCQLSLMGTYRPPLSVVGDAGDRVLGHRVAEAAVRWFVLQVARRLELATVGA